MPRYVVLDQNDMVEQVGASTSLPDGALKIVRPRDSVQKQPDIISNDGDGQIVIIEQADLITPWQCGVDEVGLSTFAELGDIGTMMREGDYLVPRPVSPKATVSGNMVTIPACPIGTEIEVHDDIGRERMALLVADSDDFTETFELMDEGTYTIMITSPLPARPSITKVEVAGV